MAPAYGRPDRLSPTCVRLMTRRLTVAIAGVVVATLLVAGLGTLVFARFGARERTRHQLEDQAAELTVAVESIDTPKRVGVLTALRRALRLEGAAIVVVGPRGNVIGTLPPGVTKANLDLERLRIGEVVSGNHGSLVWAAAPAPVTSATRVPRGSVAAVILTREADPLLRPALGWFLLSSGLTVAIGVLVAARLGRQLTRPIRQAEGAARRITAGDLAARVPVDPDARDELAALTRSINTMAEELERSRGLERQFLLSVSHDLRTPLTSIRGYAEAIADGTAPDQGHAATVILGEARRLERLVRDLLDLAKLEARRFSLHPEVVDLTDVAAGTADGFAPEAAEAAVTVTIEAPSTPVAVSADPDRLAQVAANLLENALKYAASAVRLAVSSDGGWAQLAVIDDGPGIAADDLPHVFERLYVAQREPRRQETGSGLGLAIVRELVTAMGGTVAASASPAGGAVLTVRLPLNPSSGSWTTTSTTTIPTSTT